MFALSLLLVGVMAAGPARAVIPTVQRQALIDLYNSTNGASWTNRTNWLGGVGTECSWYGITCDGEQTAVQKLDLHSNLLTGTIPATIGNLTNLQYLDLHSNLLTGTIPATIGTLTNLLWVALYSNQLTGTIPTTIANLTNLRNLAFGSNQLTGTIPTTIGNLTNVQWVSLYSNQLTGTIPTTIGNLTNLQWLWLDRNQLSGTIPETIGNLTNLQDVSLHSNQLTGTIPTTIGNLTSLQNLSLHSNRLTGTIPTTIGNLTNLQWIHLRSNQLTGTIPTSLTNLTAIGAGQLDIRWNGLFTSDASLISFLNSKQYSGDWQSTQTIAPSGVSASGATTNSIQTSWTPIAYTAGSGYYEVLKSTTSGGPYSSAGQTANKSAHSLTVTGLTPSTLYYFVVRTVTQPHANNQNTVTSDNSSQVSGATLACSYTLNPTNASVPAAGLTGQTFQVQAATGCAWTAVSNATAWLTVTGGSSGTGPGSVTYAVTASTGPQRTGTITAGGQTFTVTQDPGCTYSLNPTNATISSTGTSGLTFQVLTTSGCIWTAVSNATAWLTVTGGSSGTGNGNVTYSVAANAGSARTGTITAGGQPFTVNQGGNCTVTLIPASVSISASAAAGLTFQVQANAGCSWTASSNFSWLTVTGGASGNGNGTVTFSVSANTSTARTGTINAGDKTFTVNQDAPCTYSLTPSNATISSAGAAGQTFQVQTTSGCTWTAVSNAAWITITGGASGSGTGTVTFNVAANSGASRAGTITAGGKEFTVNQGPSSQQNLTILKAGSGAGTVVSNPAGISCRATCSASFNANAVVTLTALPDSGSTFSGWSGEGCSGSGTCSVTMTQTRTVTANFCTSCTKPSTPTFISAPVNAVRAGNAFTLAWTPVVSGDPGGTYQVDLSSNEWCTSPKRITTSQASWTISTESGKNAAYCASVRAVAGAEGCTSDPSFPAMVYVHPAPPTFIVLQTQWPDARVELNGTPPASTVVFRNVGASAGAIGLVPSGAFFTASPSFFTSVAPGADVTATIQFFSSNSASLGVKSGILTAIWTDGTTDKQISTPITLTVLTGTSTSSAGSRLRAGSLNEVHFCGPANTRPPSQTVDVINTGTLPVRIAPSIGPGGSWLSVSGNFSASLLPGQSRSYTLAVDRSRRTVSDGQPPLVTGLRFDNVDGLPEDSANFTVFDEEAPAPVLGTNRPALGSDEFSLILGSGVSSPGVGGTTYISDGSIRNRCADPASVDLYYTPDGVDGITGGSVKKNTINIEPYGHYRLADFIQGLFLASAPSGQIEIRSKSLPQLSVRSTVDSMASQPGGGAIYSMASQLAGSSGVFARYGSEIPIVGTGQGARKSSSGDTFVILPGVRSPAAGFRTNVILAETLGKPVDVAIRLFDSRGHLIGHTSRSIPAASKVQVNAGDAALFPTAGSFDGGTITVTPTAGAGAVAGFATVISNASPSYFTRIGQVVPVSIIASRVPDIQSLEYSGTPATGFIPAAAHSPGANDSFYTTNVTISNSRCTPIQVRLTYLPDDGSPSVGPITKTVPAWAEGPAAISLNDVLLTEFNVQQGAGMIRVDSPGMDGLSFGSYTTTPIDPRDPSKPSLFAVNPAPGADLSSPLGIFYPGKDEVIGLGSGAKSIVTHPAITESSAYRTNLIMAEVSGKPIQVKVTLNEKGNNIAPPKTFDLNAYQRRQVNRVLADVLGVDFQTVSRTDVEITVEAIAGEGRVVALVTKIDNDPNSKRADVYTLGPPTDGTNFRGGRQ